MHVHSSDGSHHAAPQRSSIRRSGWTFATRLVRRRWIAALAALPLLQATGCFPDPIGALNFELQSFFNTAFIDTVAVIVQNLLRL